MTNWTSLYEILDNMIHLHRAMYTLAVEKKGVLIKGDVDELLKITRQEQKLIKATEAAEASRVAAVKELFAEQGLQSTEGTLSELIKLTTSAEVKTRLTNYRNELLRIVSELRDANELNQQLLEQSLSFVNMTLDLLTDSPEQDYIYGKPTADANRSINRTFFNTRA